MEQAGKCLHRGRMIYRHALLVVTCLYLFSSCEKIELKDEDGSNDNTIEYIVPHTTGLGTQTSPYTVRQLLQKEVSMTQKAWLIGYIVGSTYRSMGNAIFAAQTTYSNNILISYDSLCNSTDKCIAVELASTNIQKQLSLAHDSTRFRKCVLVNGTIGQYFYQVGLRETIAGYLLPNIDLQVIDPQPTEWEETENEY